MVHWTDFECSDGSTEWFNVQYADEEDILNLYEDIQKGDLDINFV